MNCGVKWMRGPGGLNFVLKQRLIHFVFLYYWYFIDVCLWYERLEVIEKCIHKTIHVIRKIYS